MEIYAGGDEYGNHLPDTYLDHNRNSISVADAYFCTFYYRPFSGWELDNPAIDLRGITFLQLETPDKKRYSFWTGRLFQKTKCVDLERDRIDHIFGFEVDLFLRW